MFYNFLRRVDWQLLIPVAILQIISLTTLFSVNIDFFRNQLFFSVISSIVFFLVLQLDVNFFSEYKNQIYFSSILLLVFLLFIGAASRGAIRWIGIFGLGIQFSELLKPFLIIALSSFLAQEKNISFKTFAKILLFLLPIILLIYKQPDLGSAMVYLLTVVLTLIFYGFPLLWFGLGVLGILGMMPLLWKILHEYQRQRVLTFLQIINDPLGNSYNAIQAIIAVGSGMFFGKGLGLGTQSMLKFLPEKHTDFIFATISEDLGFFGSVLFIGVFLYLFYRFYIIFIKSNDLFSKMVVAAAFSLIFIQFFVNVGMNIGILPIVGVTLPFTSYGGSSLLSNMIILGIVSQISTKSRPRQILEIK